MNELWDLDCYEDKPIKHKTEENKKESTCLDLVTDISEGICDVITSILD